MKDNINLLNNIATSFCVGNGIEIGAFGNPIKVLGKVTYIDRLTEEAVKAHATARKDEWFKTPDIIDNGETLNKIPDKSQDFIITSHVFEHFKNPLLALFNWDRVLKKGGIIYLVVPDKRFVAGDKDRIVTTYSHLLDDFASNIMIKDDQPDVHEHCWDNVSLMEIITQFQQMYNYDTEFIYKRDFGEWSDLLAILRKN